MRLRYLGYPYQRTLALITGAVRPEGVDLEYAVGTTDQILGRAPVDVEPMAREGSCSYHIIHCARGDDRYVALPIFPSRAFRHDTVFVNVNAGIERPEDLQGKRIGVPAYAQTANFWVRGFLQHEHGVTPESIRWVRGTKEVLAYPLPPNADVAELPPGRSLSDLLEAGEVDALISLDKPACFIAGSPRVRRLFPDVVQAESDYYRRTGHFPIMHTVLVRREVYERDRSIVRPLYGAFVEAKRQSYLLTADTGVVISNLPFQVAHVEQTQAVFGDDPFPYGLARNRHTLGALAQYIHEQGYTDRVMPIDELFVPELLET